MSTAVGCSLNPLSLSEEMKQIWLFFKHTMHFDDCEGSFMFFSLPRIFCFTSPACFYCSDVTFLLKLYFLTPGKIFFMPSLFLQSSLYIISWSRCCLCLVSPLSSRMSCVLFNKCMTTLIQLDPGAWWPSLPFQKAHKSLIPKSNLGTTKWPLNTNSH